MLTEIFGMEWYKVHEEAEQLEHAVSADFERRLLEKLGTGEACPHGNRVEGDTPQDRRDRGLQPLDEAPAESQSIVVSVFERDRRLLEQLCWSGYSSGRRGADASDELRRNAHARSGQAIQLGKSEAAVWVAVVPVSAEPGPVQAGSGSSR